jgi:uncharacterized membrane protein YkvA (DUF1232 family)
LCPDCNGAHAGDVIHLVNKLPLKAVLPILGAMLYGASPLDLIPDLIPVLGLVDDAFVVPLLLLIGVIHLRNAKVKAKIPVRR